MPLSPMTPLSVPHGWSLPKAVSTPGRRKAGPLKELVGLFRVRRGCLVRRATPVLRARSGLRGIRGTQEIKESRERRARPATRVSKVSVVLAGSRGKKVPRGLLAFRD